jgi:8-oxo-dGTP pyrophosphatase MutT (NUDIX family)
MSKPTSEPAFVPRPDQVDYSNIRYCPVINCALTRSGKVLVVRRSQGMRLYPGYWNGLSGFLDDKKSIEEKVYEELREEAGLAEKDVISVRVGRVITQEAPDYGKTWMVFPVEVAVKDAAINLDWEAETHQWLPVKEALRLQLVPGFDTVLQELFLS